jgi:hypothetical protein
MKPTSFCLFAGMLLAAAGVAGAQQYSIDWYTIDGGGGTSTSAVYTVSGTIGQPDAGSMSGGNFSLTGGFWSAISVIQTPGAPLLNIAAGSSGVVLSWPAPSTGFQLQKNNDLSTTNWVSVLTTPSDDGKTRSVTVTPATGNWVYRLKK